MKNRNNIKYCLTQTSYNCAIFLMSGSLIQSFLLECGISEKQTSIYISVLQMVQMLAMILVSKAMQKIKNIFRIAFYSVICQLPIFVVMLFFCAENDISVQNKYIIIFVVSIIVNIFQGTYMILSYKLPYHIINMEDYGKIMGGCGAVWGIVSVVLSGALNFFVERKPYFMVMAAFSMIGGFLLIAAALVTLSFHESDIQSQQQDVIKKSIFTYPPFYQLLLPNFFRGVSTGIFNMITVIGYYYDILDVRLVSILVVVSQIMLVIGNLLYSFLSMRKKDGISILISGVGFCIAAPLILVGHSGVVFLSVYAIAYFFVNIINCGVPFIVAKHVNYNYIGEYTAWRMAMHALGTAAGGAAVVYLLDYCGGYITMWICGFLLLICVVCYYLFEKRKLPVI